MAGALSLDGDGCHYKYADKDQDFRCVSDEELYPAPKRPVSLDGPVQRPEPGTLPVRGDVAHIALAHRYLAPSYVTPLPRKIGELRTALHLTASSESETLAQLAPGQPVELLDQAGDWAWICLGPEGPSGYVLAESLVPLKG